MVNLDALEQSVKQAARTRKALRKASDARANLSPGTGRARVTTANAKAKIFAESYQEALCELEALIRQIAKEGLEF